MAATQIPKSLGILMLFVGVPLILWGAARTNDEVDALGSSEHRQAHCVEKTASTGLALGKREELCRCMAAEATKRGVPTTRLGYEKDALEPVADLCFQVHLVQ